jgi:hypothetical protein
MIAERSTTIVVSKPPAKRQSKKPKNPEIEACSSNRLIIRNLFGGDLSFWRWQLSA